MTGSRPFEREEALALWGRILAGWANHLDESGARLLINGITNVHDAGGSYEGVTRMLWGLGGWLSAPERTPLVTWRGQAMDTLDLTRRALLNGTDPASPGYWGVPATPGANDQRTVESGQVAFALWQSRHLLWDTLSPVERDQVVAWLHATGVRPERWRSNWSLFWALNHRVRQALGADHDPDLVIDVLDYLDGVYCGDGWYDDGPVAGTDHWDDYNLWVFSSHVLALAEIEEQRTPRMEQLLERVRLQMNHAPWFFAADGSYPEYGRSLAYKFARLGALIWAYRAGCWPHSVGKLRRLVGRHLRWYVDRGAIRADGSLRQELTSEGSSEIRETYVSTGATYWAMQAFGGLWSLPDDDPFWTTEEEPLPVESGDFVKVFPQPGFVLTGTQATGQVHRYSSRSHHNAAKYGKYLYATNGPFNVGLADGQPLPDAMLCLTDGTVRGHKNEVIGSVVGEPGWLRFRYPQVTGELTHLVETVIVPRGEWHLRVHIVEPDPMADCPIYAIEGASPLGYPAGAIPVAGVTGQTSWATYGGATTAIAGIESYASAELASSFGAPGANSVFGRQLTPHIRTVVLGGRMILVSVAHTGSVLNDPADLERRVDSVGEDREGAIEIGFADGSRLVIPPLATS